MQRCVWILSLSSTLHSCRRLIRGVGLIRKPLAMNLFQRPLAIFGTLIALVSCSPSSSRQVNDAPMTQPTPSVTTDDVYRIIKRDFGDSRVAEVQEILNGYGTQDWQRESARVHLAVLKLAGGDLSRLRQHTEMACSDYRDVLSPAEYRRYSDLVWSGTTDKSAKEEAIRNDWDEYQTWLARK